MALKFSNKNKLLNINDYKLISDHYKNSKLPSDIKKYFKRNDLNKIIKFMKTDKKIYKILNVELNKYIHSIQILIN